MNSICLDQLISFYAELDQEMDGLSYRQFLDKQLRLYEDGKLSESDLKRTRWIIEYSAKINEVIGG